MSASTITTESDLQSQSISTLFWKYTLPTIAAMLVTGIYVAIDGMFVGHFLGEEGLAGIMLGYPIASILYAVGALIGMGASALVSIKLGEGNNKQAKAIVGTAFTMCAIAALTLSSIGLIWSSDILQWLGAEGNVYDAAKEYLDWYFLLGLFPVYSMAFSSLLRNDGKPTQVTYIMILGGVLNVILDWVFIVLIPWGLMGAAVATMLSQAVTAALCLFYFIGKRSQLSLSFSSIFPNWRLCLHIAQLGSSSFLMYLYLSVVLTLHNKAFLWVGDAVHVAAYGIVSYTEAVFYLIFEGIALGIQPIASFNTGAKQFERVRQIRNIAFFATLLVAAIGLIFTYGFPEWVIYLFSGDNPTVYPVALEGMRYYFWGLPMEGLLLVGATYFQAINHPKDAALLTGGKLILIMVMLFCFSMLWGIQGVWLALPITSSLLCCWMVYRVRTLKSQ